MVDDTWDTLPEQVRRLMLAASTGHRAGAAGWATVHEGIASHNRRWRALRPPLLSAAGLRELHDLSDRLMTLILEACRRRARTAGELRERLGVAPGHLVLLDEDAPLTEELLAAARPDILVSGGVPRFVEFNIDGALGGAMDSDAVAARYAALYQAHGITDLLPLRAAPSAVDGRFAAIRAAVDPAPGSASGPAIRVAMLMDLDSGYPGMEDPERFLNAFAPVTAAATKAGLDLVPWPVGRLRLDADRRLLADGGPVDAAFRLFGLDKVPATAGLGALETAVQAGTVTVFTPAASWLLSNKLALAWLWQDADSLPAADRDLVHRHVPRTVACTAEELDRALAGRHDLVLKPAGGSGGAGVLLGRETTAPSWRAGLDHAVQTGGYLLQEYVTSDGLPMPFVDLDDGSIVEASVPYCLGPYLFGRRQCGGEVRFGFPGGGAVLNLDRGALVSGLLLTP